MDTILTHRVCVLPYANALPLVHFIKEVYPPAELIYRVPRSAVAALLEGRAQVALVPVAGYFRRPDLAMIPGLGICANGNVTSVLLQCHRPLSQVRVVRLDPESRTSNVLAQVLMRDHFRVSHRVEYRLHAEEADACVCIGDRCQRYLADCLHYDVGPAECESMSLFRRLAADLLQPPELRRAGPRQYLPEEDFRRPMAARAPDRSRVGRPEQCDHALRACRNTGGDCGPSVPTPKSAGPDGRFPRFLSSSLPSAGHTDWCGARDMAEWKQRLRELMALGNITIGVSNLGSLQTAREHRCRDILADYPLNTANSIAADELSTLGAQRVTASVELTFPQLSELTKAVRMPVEMIGQGPVCGLLLEHCLLATASGQNPQGVCSMPCRRGVYALEDAAAQLYPLETDRRCRNHLFTPADVCVLPSLARMLSLGISGLRIEGQLDQPETVAAVTRVYREAIDSLKNGQTIDVAEGLSRISAATGRPLSDGPFDFQSIQVADKEKELART